MIDRIKLTNYLAFRELSLATRNLTLLTGANSGGKSSILHSLAMLRQSAEAQTLPGALLLNGRLIELGLGGDVLHADPVAIEGHEEVLLGIGVELDQDLLHWTAAYDQSADVLTVKAEPAELPNTSLFKPGFQYLKADRIVPQVTYPKSHEQVTVKRSLGPRGEHVANFLRVHGDEVVKCEAAVHPDGASPRLLDQTNAWLNSLSPGTSLDVADVEGTDFVRLRFRRAGPEVKTDPQRATNVGFGLTYALPVVVACLMAAEGDLLLMENPEAHLHPRGQALLGRLCALAASCGAQVSVESHSDHDRNAIRLAIKHGELQSDRTIMHFFDRESGVLQPGLSTVEVNREGMIEEWPKGFFDQWDQAIEQLLD